MQGSTFDAIRALLRADSTLTPKDRAAITEAVRNNGQQSNKTKPDLPEVLTRKQAAEQFNRTTRFIDMLAASGTLPRVVMPGRVRGCGYRLSDVKALIEGKGGLDEAA